VSIRESRPPVVLKGHAALIFLDITLAAEDEQVSDLSEVDLPAGPSPEVAEGLEAARRYLNIEGVRELGAHAAGGSTGGTATQLSPLQKDGVDARLGQVIGRAGSDDPASDDDHLSRVRER